MRRKYAKIIEVHEGPAMSMMGVYHSTKGTDKQKRAKVREVFKDYFNSLPKGRQTRLV